MYCLPEGLPGRGDSLTPPLSAENGSTAEEVINKSKTILFNHSKYVIYAASPVCLCLCCMSARITCDGRVGWGQRVMPGVGWGLPGWRGAVGSWRCHPGRVHSGGVGAAFFSNRVRVSRTNCDVNMKNEEVYIKQWAVCYIKKLTPEMNQVANVSVLKD